MAAARAGVQRAAWSGWRAAAWSRPARTSRTAPPMAARSESLRCPGPMAPRDAGHLHGSPVTGGLGPEQPRSQRAHPVDVLLSDHGEVGWRHATQVAAVQEPELDGLVLVGDHRATGSLATDFLGVPPSEPSGRDAREPRDLGRVEEAALRAVAECGGEHGALLATRPDREADEEQKRRRHQEEV